jgi:hypothetical protein
MSKKAIFAIFLSLPLAACYSDQERALGKCKFAAQLKYPESTWQIGYPRQSYLEGCMEAAGYNLSQFQDSCPKDNAIDYGALLPECYIPMGVTDSVIVRAEMWIRQKGK